MNAAIVGGTGYGAVELIRLLKQHPSIQLNSVISKSQSGTLIQDAYPHLQDIYSHTMDEYDIHTLGEETDLVFFATPAGVSKDLVSGCLDKGITCVDLSGDFRLTGDGLYETWYKKSPPEKSVQKKATYGLTEIYRKEIKETSLISNPGCYPTATLLALMPLFKTNWAKEGGIVIDGKSGVSGAGRGMSLNTHFSETNESLKAYKPGTHQHIPEIEQFLNTVSEEEVTVTFTPHLVPMTRGLLCTISVEMKEYQTTKDLISYYEDFYKNDPFVRIRPEGKIPATKEVYGSNFCDIGFYSDKRTGRLTIVSAIDNLGKGAAGQAIQNVNVMNGWEETAGLGQVPVYP
ncbi:N-acetyl-gamma-glutamyl-phosphate reductase [Bacillus sp. H-16]|uniref:N-acetyl-gamma-glutamyl-phosphate reductase n=1 Tax=Alteribacter salitolerans TaxID=2912333 RepID=UPI00196650D7|nr:N-acetyl-gamma-glutamyl-phosphate reductase [Alteribacter salitolerans]MBM7096097.1 N-acetyl-gamma-glutamyl-phosphate reductase [Alteribacter salitolerans]